MNVITFNKAYCLFPRATLEAGRSLLSSSTQGVYRNRGKALAKYTERGFDVAFSLPPGDLAARKPMFPLGWRWLDDENSWVIPLDTFGVDVPSRPNQLSLPLVDDPSIVCNWQTQYSSTKGAIMRFAVIKSDLLRYRYVIADRDLSDYLARYLAIKLQVEGEKMGRNSETWTLCVMTIRA